MTAIGVFCATEHSMGDKLAGNRQKATCKACPFCSRGACLCSHAGAEGTNTVKYSYLQARPHESRGDIRLCVAATGVPTPCQVLGIEVSQGAAGLGGLALSREEEEFFDQLAKDPC
eukprot:5195954-Amphidinium_carterae.1